ncbi:hypothetical protein [Enterococcus faecium]|uniref:hypothetical protein n=1 Tax=Enterococcus faecium TaxID=1352 RepID=UPI000F4EA98F|nr:hypothetical protein [Enterococcus faecium]MDP8584428.1 hypothetical protein [Listeria innocua]EKG9127503.1 hypothetical protein [Enterococcus faecium]MCE3189190.1 hypothetical protein [Enterococcus faecium]MCU2176833.1 hypothetical protein [Enterococcus faecium]MDQ8484000.1 hypothetical protein [Enterococcus faecium]
MAEEKDIKEAKDTLVKYGIEQIKKFKSTTVFVLIILCLGGYFLLKLLNNIEDGFYKDFLITIIVLFVLYVMYNSIRYVFKSEKVVIEDENKK